MRILVTGANSPLGHSVSQFSKEAGHYVVGSVRSDKLELEFDHLDDRIVIELDDPVFCERIPTDLDCIVHIAAAHTGSPQALFKVNGIAVHELAEFAAKTGIKKFIHISSMSVYGAVKEPIVGVKSSIRHSSPYGLSKWAGECYLAAFSSRFASVSIRSPAIIGSGASRNFLAKLVFDMLNGREEIVLENPAFFFNNAIHYKTFARFIVSLVEADLNSHDYFPVASSMPLPLEVIVQHIASRLDYKGHISWCDSGSSPFSIDTDYAQKFGFRPRAVMEEIDEWLNSESLPTI
jgi:nucleoside-diphosphate-sugar epimerase